MNVRSFPAVSIHLVPTRVVVTQGISGMGSSVKVSDNHILHEVNGYRYVFGELLTLVPRSFSEN